MKNILRQNINTLICCIVTLILAAFTIYAVLKGSGISLNELIADLRDASLWGLIPASIGTLGFIWFEERLFVSLSDIWDIPQNGHRALSMPLQMCIFLLLHRRLPVDSLPVPFS